MINSLNLVFWLSIWQISKLPLSLMSMLMFLHQLQKSLALEEALFLIVLNIMIYKWMKRYHFIYVLGMPRLNNLLVAFTLTSW